MDFPDIFNRSNFLQSLKLKLESPQRGTPNFIPTLDLPDIFNRSNFEYSALRGLKVDSQRRKRKKSKKKEEK